MQKLPIVLMFVAAAAHAQNCTGYTKEYKVTVQPGAITGTLANYTMLISGTYPYLSVGGAGFATSVNGYDITFNINNVPTTWNMPIYVSGTGQIKANVLIPSAFAPPAGAAAVVSMCVGNSSIMAFRGGASAYDAATNIALQFSSAGLGVDSTGQNTTLTNNGVVSAVGPTALVDAASFAGAQSLVGGPGNFQAVNGPLTIGFWVNQPSLAEAVFVSYGTSAGDVGKAFSVISYPTPWNHMSVWNSNSTLSGASAGTIVPSTWHKWEVIYSSGVTYRLDGAAAGTGVFPGALSTQLGSLSIGRQVPGGTYGGYYPMTGLLADVRISNVARSVDWSAAEYLNQSNPAAFYAVTLVNTPTPPVLFPVVITANSPLSVKAVWTTDVLTDSQIQCGTTSGVYTFNSSIVNANPNWSVTAHSMASNPMPNGSYYCRAKSIAATGGLGVSTETLVVLPAPTPSVPIAMVNPVVVPTIRLGDRYTGMNGAPVTGAFSSGDNAYFCWAEDNFEYIILPGFNGLNSWSGQVNNWMMVTQLNDATHTSGTKQGLLWQNGVNNFPWNNTGQIAWLGSSCISVKGNMYLWPTLLGTANPSFMMKTSDHWVSNITPQHNIGRDTTYITAMTCTGSGIIKVTSKLNITDELPHITLPAAMAMYVAGAVGAGVNGVFGPVITASTTATDITWQRDDGTANHTAIPNCTGWSYTPSGGTGSGGGTINVYGWDIPSTVSTPGNIPLLSWVQNDGPGYENGTAAAGMDSFVYAFAYGIAGIQMGLIRMRVEDMETQDFSKIGYYIGKQNGDDGIYESAWDYTHASATNMNVAQFALVPHGKGAEWPQSQYLTALNRFVLAFELSGAPGVDVDSCSGGTAIYDAGPYPWSPLTLIGSAQRNPDVYWRAGSGPEFPQFVAKSQRSVNGVTSISLEHDGGNFGINANPNANDYDIFMTPNVQFVAKGTMPAKPLLAVGEAVVGMDLAYNFDVPSGSLSMPNAAPSDAQQKWAWKAPNTKSPMYTDLYGSIYHSMPSVSSAGGRYPSDGFLHIPFTAPYAQALPGALTVMNCFGHYPAVLLADPGADAIVLKKGTDLTIAYAGAKAGTVMFSGGVVTSIAVATGGKGYLVAPTVTITGGIPNGGTTNATATTTITGGIVTAINIISGGSGYTNPPLVVISPTWNVNFLGTPVGNVLIPDNSIGCVVVRRDSSNRVSLYTSAGIGKSLPLTPSATATVAGAWTTSPLVIGDAVNSFWGIESLLRVWSRDLADDELISEMAAIRGVLWSRGKGSAIP